MNKIANYLIAGLLFVTISNSLHAQSNSISDKAYKANWRLVFSDEFDSTALNSQKWRNSFPWGRWTHGLQYSTDGNNFLFDQSRMNIKIDDDTLTARIDFWDSLGNYKPYNKHFDYTSGMIYSNRSFKYGYFESKAKIPATKGLNSAFWLYGANDCEVDIFEIQGSTPSIANMTLHWKDSDIFTNSSQSIYHIYTKDTTFAQKEYTFGLKWKQKELVFYLDGKEIKEDVFTRFIRARHIPDVNMNVIFTSEVGTMDGTPDLTSSFPSYFNVDYFRAYSNDTISPPVILGQKPLTINYSTALPIVPEMLIVDNYYQTYPSGFKLVVMEGSNYSLNGNIITPNNKNSETLYIPVKVNDGIDDSPIYTLKIAILKPTSVLQNNIKKGMVLFPNPVKQFLNINIELIGNQIDSVDIFDIQGIRFMHQNSPDQGKIDVSSLRKGMYFITFNTNKGKQILKFIKD